MSLRYLLLLVSSLSAAATATSLYATHYNGDVYALSLDESADGYELSLAQTLDACGGYPSWLTLDANRKVLYCSDETGSATSPGSLSTLAIDDSGALTETTVTTSSPGSGVHSVIYGDEGEYLAVAHYGGSAVSTYRLPLQGNADDLLQDLRYNLTQPAPHPQQDAPHPHQVILDPTGAFILSPDLGADLVRIYSIDKSTGHLSPCPNIAFTPGEGPRHGVFAPRALAVPASASLRHRRRQIGALPTTFYVATELGGHVYAYDVSYSGACPVFRQSQKITPYTGGEVPEGASLGEIQQTLGEIYVSIRSDQGFAPDDSIATLDRGAVNGTLSFRELTSAGGKVPRTWVLNPEGDLAAVGNQASSTVVIVKRDVETGALGEEVASLQVGESAEPGTMGGLSSVVWGL